MAADSNRNGEAARLVYRFGGGTADGAAAMAHLLGTTGANLAGLAALHLPVPPGFTLSTQVCTAYHAANGSLPGGLESHLLSALAETGLSVGAEFGNPNNPLLVSVISAAPNAMPGLKDPIISLGLNDATVEGLAKTTGDRRQSFDSYRRFIVTYAVAVLGVNHGVFDALLDQFKAKAGCTQDSDLTAEDWQAVIGQFQSAIETGTGAPFPQDVGTQLWGAVKAGLNSWTSDRAIAHRRLTGTVGQGGVAITIQAMIPGTHGKTSGTGVAFTRDPVTGEPGPVGECFLKSADGAQRVSRPLMANALSLEAAAPCLFAQLKAHCETLERHHAGIQEVEFAIEDDRIWMLHSRPGKLTTKAALKLAVDLAEAGVISRERALLQIDPSQLDPMLHPTLDPDAEKIVIAIGLPSSPGAASGAIVFTADDAEKFKAQGLDALLVRDDIGPKDIRGIFAAVATLTIRGGLTGHAEMVARGMGRPFVSAARALRIDETNGLMTAGGQTFHQGDIITIDGSTGQVFKGRIAMRPPVLSGDFAKLMGWADMARRMKVRANAETPRDARQARDFGAEGIGLCRTEHMFFETNRILAMREMILAENEAGRRTALAKILPMQRQDFIEMFEIMAGFPVTIRLLDPPLHEFLPKRDAEIIEVAAALDVPVAKVRRRLAELLEVNPMLGFRGCRLGLAYPEIIEMQSRAIFEAAIAAAKMTGEPVMPEIMVPLVSYARELEAVKSHIVRTASAVESETGVKLVFQVGTMIELPRAALKAGKIAQSAEFFSFGTNDLTQTALGLSRDDAAPILANYLNAGIIETDPFHSLDIDGVGELVAIAAARGRATRPDLKLGVCGEHGGDPKSIAFFEATGLDYISCSPFRLPVARLAAAHAALKRRVPHA